jgi:hypothetical protein
VEVTGQLCSEASSPKVLSRSKHAGVTNDKGQSSSGLQAGLQAGEARVPRFVPLVMGTGACLSIFCNAQR